MGGYVKITFEDIDIAKNFFENEKHLDEFLINVCKYYCGFENVFKYKNVKKYFETYKKTMDRVILGRSNGSIGGKKRVENQQDTSNTLEGVLEGGVKDPVQPKLRKERKETKLKKEIKNKYGEFGNVLLTEIEFNSSQEKYKHLLPKMIKKLDEYIESKGAKYSSHYATFSSWVHKSVIEDMKKNTQSSAQNNHGIPVN